MTPVDRVRSALAAAGSRRNGRDWQCPAHDDQRASLSVKEGRDGRVLLYCHAGCETQTVLVALRLDWPDLYPDDRSSKAKAEIIATYDYTDANGNLLYQSVRYFPKDFRRRRPDGNGGWTWKLDDTRQVLYRLPRVAEAVARGETIYVVEGEKDVHAIERAGATATTTIGGVNGPWLAEYSKLLARTRVVVVADDDEPGHQRARRIAGHVRAAGGIVDLVRSATGRDAADHLAAGKALADFLPLGPVDDRVATDDAVDAARQIAAAGAKLVDLTQRLNRDPVAEVAVDGAALLDEAYGALTRYVAFPSGEAAVAVALWVAASHAQPAWEHATRLVATSPLKRCGKTRLLDVLEALCHNVLPTVNISVAALVRSIVEDDPPTLLLDEADTIFGRRRGERAEQAEDLRGILNAGHARGRPYIRWDQAARQRETCPTFAMAALAAIGDLPDTLTDRSVVVAMRRRAPGEVVASLRRRRDLPGLHHLRDRLHAWARAHLDELAAAEPAMPVEDRAADVWEPLVAVADLAGADWPDLARSACTRLTSTTGVDDDGDQAERLLADLHDVFGADERVDSKTLLDRLHKLDEAPWADLHGKGLDARGLAKLLRPYGVRPKTIRVGTDTPRGYERADLLDPSRRYLPHPQQAQHRNSAGQEPAGVAGVADTPASKTERNALTSDVASVALVADTPASDERQWCGHRQLWFDPDAPGAACEDCQQQVQREVDQR